MIKKYLIFFLISFFFNKISYSAGTDNILQEPPKSSNYKLATKAIERAKKYERKKKLKKAKINYEKAIEFLHKSNIEKPSDADTMNYLGFATRKLGDFENAEIYYLLGLEIEPNHNGINEYLGELYLSTNRIDKAKERLEVLKNCKCKEFKKLKNSIKLGITKY